MLTADSDYLAAGPFYRVYLIPDLRHWRPAAHQVVEQGRAVGTEMDDFAVQYRVPPNHACDGG
jgi:hypothetical protein